MLLSNTISTSDFTVYNSGPSCMLTCQAYGHQHRERWHSAVLASSSIVAACQIPYDNSWLPRTAFHADVGMVVFWTLARSSGFCESRHLAVVL